LKTTGVIITDDGRQVLKMTGVTIADDGRQVLKMTGVTITDDGRHTETSWKPAGNQAEF
jgi:hypothetical protein